MKGVNKDEMIQELDNINLELTKEEQVQLDQEIETCENKVYFAHKVRTHLAIIAVLALLTIPMFSGIMIVAPVIAAAALLSLSAYFRSKMIYHSYVLVGLKEPAEDTREQLKGMIQDM